MEQLKSAVWTPLERRCLYLLQRTKNTRLALLQIHAFMLHNALDLNVNLVTKLVASCACPASVASDSDPLAGLRHARLLFDKSPHRDDGFLCNAMIKAHVGLRQFDEALVLYRDLRRNSGFSPDNFTFTALAKCCCSLAVSCWEGLQVQCHAVKMGFSSDLYVSTAFVDLYAKWGSVEAARMLFDDMSVRSLVSWTALIGGYARIGDMQNAMKLFKEMPEKDSAAFNLMIDGYVKLGDMDPAKDLFDEMPERNVVSWTTMINGYCNISDLKSARSLFDAMPEKNLFSWNVIINGYCQNKQPHEALRLFYEMQSTALVEPDEVTLVCVLPAIADLGAVDLGNRVYRFAEKKKLDRASNVGTALVDMFAKCGEIGKAKKVFNVLHERQVASWNALINGLAVNGRGKEALQKFLEMQQQGVPPNDITMIGVLSACNHAGLVKEGKKWFKAMDEFGLAPRIEHYGCMVDLLGRAGYLEEAENIIKSMPYEPNAIIWSSFLFACGYFKDVIRAERVRSRTVNMEPQNDGNYIMLRNIYAAEKRWTDAEEIKRLMSTNGANKETGCSVIEIDGRMSEFLAGNRLHPHYEIIHSMLGQLLKHMRGQVIDQALC
ncbi:pentatricopeptide repeat-containing protein At2g44880-like [Rhodamnia argentea]|uniref:Pentatricopeptide repeat-containing protein At2g44880-like n=1 Tax=Rhodamnia argentea TaxID=178133 RepID=A0ABM3HYU1_9MYRT|nr:pentatricopeptide repeat-containing protein At2g44880-like [Rhodamnia argentea]XP_048141767.1 pentatricopeptide repeat-containing protein At2g44880-like [Rhodamnia argentea]